MPSDYDQIRADNIREYGEGTRHLSFLGRLYTDRTHFIFELLQNAEDAGASRILFSLFDDRLLVTHNGRPFNELDVRGLCGVGEGTKSDDLTQIGTFGIGFKSVYAYTSAPTIHSGDEHFRIEHYVRPYPTDPIDIESSQTTAFVFPFDPEITDALAAYQEIADRLRKLSARSLLFLRKVQEIEYKLTDGTFGVYHREVISRGSCRQVTVVGQNNGVEESESWLIFERSVGLPDSLRGSSASMPVEIGFLVEIDEKDQVENIARIIESPLIVSFPTEKETRFGFLIQGPYKTTPARDNIPKDDEWNATLVDETASLLVEALLNLREMGFLTTKLLETLPIRTHDFPEGSMFYPILGKVREALLSEELLPATDGSFVTAGCAKLARSGELRNILNQSQLCSFFQANSALKWLSTDITLDRTPDLRSYLMNELNVEEITPESFARTLSSSFLKNQPDEWFTGFFGFLAGQEALWRAPRWEGAPMGVLRTKPILRLQDNRQIRPFRSDGRPTAFLPPSEHTDLPVVKREIAGNEQPMVFLKRLGLSEPDLFDEIVERVLPKYTGPENPEISLIEHETDIRKVLHAMSGDSEAGKKKVAKAAAQTPFLMASDQNGNRSFRAPEEIYTNTDELRCYFSSTPSVWFLDEKGPDAQSVNTDPWSGLGIARLPRRIQISEGFSAAKREYSTRSETTKNFDLHGLEDFLESLQHVSDPDKRRGRSLVLWSFLDRHLRVNQNFFRGTYEWFYRKERLKHFECLILKRLQEAKWITTRDGEIRRPDETVTSQLTDECIDSNELINALGIQRETNPDNLLGEVKKRIQARELGCSLEDIDFVSRYPLEFEQWKSTIASQQQPDFPERASSDPDRRKERLGEQLGSAPHKEYGPRERSIRSTRKTVDPYVWLRNQYLNEADQMICQICKAEMPFRKRDGEHFFEAVEALTTVHFAKEHEAQFLALCPLCAAMYKEFVKRDEEVMTKLRATLMNAEDLQVPLRLGKLETSIRFVETHFQDIQTILTGQASNAE